MSRLRMIAGGVKSLFPFFGSYSMAARPVDVRYGYGVWLRHISGLAAAGVRGPFRRVAELGPGNSATIGACALHSGASAYIGLDVLPHLAVENLRTTFDETAALFSSSTPIPAGGEYSTVYPEVPSVAFPELALATFRGEGTVPVDPTLLQSNLAVLENGGRGGEVIQWICPWNAESLPAGSIDLVFSQAVLQEIPVNAPEADLASVFKATARFLRAGGIASHQIDLGFYGDGPWNIHWTWSELEWRLVRGRRENFVNREPVSTYLTLARNAGFEIVSANIVHDPGVSVHKLAPRYRALEDAERTARAAHLILRKVS
jgi:hypothetical protein